MTLTEYYSCSNRE